MLRLLSISYPDISGRADRAEEPSEGLDRKYTRPCSLLWCLFSAAQLLLRVGLETTAFFYALCKGGDAGLVEFEATLRATSRTLASGGPELVSTAGLVGRTALLLGCVALFVGVTVAVGDELGSWVWGG